MMQRLKKHLGYYTLLFVVFTFGLYAVALFSGNVQAQMMVIVILTFFYIIWGITHHYIHHDVTAKIVLEYVLIGAVGISVIFFILK